MRAAGGDLAGVFNRSEEKREKRKGVGPTHPFISGCACSYPFMIRGSIIWCCGQIDAGFW